jgi:hypothetical protein
MRTELTEVVRHHQANGSLPSDASPAALASLVMSIIPGFMLQLALFGPEVVDQIPDAARALWPAAPSASGQLRGEWSDIGDHSRSK